VFDLGDDELLDGVEADGAEPDRVERGPPSFVSTA
jgi:hypothetical protein